MGVGVTSRLPIALSSVLAIALAVVAGPAVALGLGQLQVKSQRSQPLVAEIPIISSDPAELQGLQVRLASPETFTRVGLDPPQGTISTLQFTPALDAAGRPVIRVTSPTPVPESLLTFLIEVDWGDGRLVREYSALLDAPRTVSAPLQAPIQAPVAAPPNTIVRPVEAPPVAAEPLPEPPPVATAPAPPPPGAIPLPPPAVPSPPVPPPPSPAPEIVAAPALTAPPAPEASNELGPVKRGQTLGGIAAGLDAAQQYSLAQTMLALLRANPDAFIGDNINRLKEGAVLRVPPSDEIAHYSATEAAAVVREQIAQWRDARRPPPQPATVATTASGRSASRGNDAAAGRAPSTGARLEIVPPSNGRRTGGRSPATQSGIETGGEGEMLRQQLQETRETLAARDAEVNELKSRVAELEKLQQQQQQLITMKDSEQAAAQQTLATANRQPPAPATTAQVQQPATPPQPQANANSWIWLVGGIVLVLAALVGWLLTRRRQRAAVPVRGFDTAAMAASIPATESVADVPGDQSVDVAGSADLPAADWTSAPAAVGAVPTWHDAGATAEASVAPTLANDAGQKLELAQAYLDMGDDAAARTLLREVLDGRDPAARETAARMLRDL